MRSQGVRHGWVREQKGLWTIWVWVSLLLPGRWCPHASPSPPPLAVPDLPSSTWHGDPGEGLRLAQRVHLDVPERLAHRALQVPATQGDACELLGLGAGSESDPGLGL